MALLWRDIGIHHLTPVNQIIRASLRNWKKYFYSSCFGFALLAPSSSIPSLGRLRWDACVGTLALGRLRWDACARDLFILAAERKLLVQIHREIQDQRMHWMLPVAPLASAELEWLLANPPAIKVLLSGLTSADLRGLQPKILEAPNVWADLCRVRDPVFGIEKIAE